MKLCDRDYTLESVANDELVDAYWHSLNDREQDLVREIGRAFLARDETRLAKWMPDSWDLDELFLYATEFQIEVTGLSDPAEDEDNFIVTTAAGQPGKRIDWRVLAIPDDMSLVLYLEVVDGRSLDDSACIEILKPS